MQIEMNPMLFPENAAIDDICSLIRTHFKLGGTQINMNVIDERKLREAHKNPETHPDLIVRVTGFSAYFASLSPEFRQLVIDRYLGTS